MIVEIATAALAAIVGVIVGFALVEVWVQRKNKKADAQFIAELEELDRLLREEIVEGKPPISDPPEDGNKPA